MASYNLGVRLKPWDLLGLAWPVCSALPAYPVTPPCSSKCTGITIETIPIMPVTAIVHLPECSSALSSGLGLFYALAHSRLTSAL